MKLRVPPEAEEGWMRRRRLLEAAGRVLPPVDADLEVWPVVRAGTAVWDGWCRIGAWEVFLYVDPGIWPDLQSLALWRAIYATRRFRPAASFLVIPFDDHPARCWRWAVRLRARRIAVALAPDPRRWADPGGWRRWGIWPAGGTDPPPAAGWSVDARRDVRRYARVAERALEAPEALRLLLRMAGVHGWWRADELEALWGEEAREGIRQGRAAGLLETVGGGVRPTLAGEQIQLRLFPDPGGGRRRRKWGNRHPDSSHSRMVAGMLVAFREAGWAIQGGGREVLLAGHDRFAVPDAVVIARDRDNRPWLWVLEAFREMRGQPPAAFRLRLARLLTLLDGPPDFRTGVWIRGPERVLRETLPMLEPPGRLRWHLGSAPPDPAADRLHLPAILRI